MQLNMATTIINNYFVQSNLLLDKQIERWDLKLIQKKLKLLQSLQCKPSWCNVHTLTKYLAHSLRNLT